VSSFYPQTLNQVHVELTDRCNAACPMCARNNHGGHDRPGLPDVEITLAQARVIFEPTLLKMLKRVVLCGDYGDPAMAREALDIVRFLRTERPDLWISFHSNGSLRTPDWWRELGSMIPDLNRGKVVFGIDGLADTNHIYRRRTSFEKIMENARAAIAGGAYATWDFIVFKHNEHQIEEARAMAKSMGFAEFRPKRTFRFYRGYRGRWPVKNRAGVNEYWIDAPDNPEYRNDVPPPDGTIPRAIHCKSIQQREVYVTSEGLVLPCCHLGYLHTDTKDGVDDLNTMIDAHGGRDTITAFNRPILDIIEGPLFKAISDRWTTDPLPTCKFTCGRVIDNVSQTLPETT